MIIAYKGGMDLDTLEDMPFDRVEEYQIIANEIYEKMRN